VSSLFHQRLDIFFRRCIVCGVWTVEETNEARKQITKAPLDVHARYEFWKGIVEQSGPAGLRAVKGYHDEALHGALKGKRSSRLGLKWRVMYVVEAGRVVVTVVRVSAHDYK
jgi:toxin HigB-1